MDSIEYRYELKYVISKEIALLLKQQLTLLMQRDSHSIAKDYSYLIRSLYFDSPYNNAYFEKIDGVEIRKKYRIRMYNSDDSFISLECKHKDGNMTFKESCRLSKEQTQQLIDNTYQLKGDDPELLKRFYIESKAQALKPAVVVDYKRLALTYPVSEVRITFDEEIHSGNPEGFFNPDLATIPVIPYESTVLEVKCNEYIPAHILAVIDSVPTLRQAVSKFALCREINF